MSMPGLRCSHEPKTWRSTLRKFKATEDDATFLPLLLHPVALFLIGTSPDPLTAFTDGCREIQPEVPLHAPVGLHHPMSVLPQSSQVVCDPSMAMSRCRQLLQRPQQRPELLGISWPHPAISSRLSATLKMKPKSIQAQHLQLLLTETSV